METTKASDGTICKGNIIMKTIEVVAAIIHKDKSFFATQRGYGEFEGLWEFPGGSTEMNANSL